MAWQDVFPNVGPKLDAEHERERRLVEQARVGADWALAALIARYQPPVTRYLTRLTGSPTRARILAEHVFIRMERRLHGSQGGRQLRLWLLRACTEAGLEMLRGPREAKSPQLVEARMPVGLLSGSSSPAASFLRAGLGRLVTATGSTSRQVRKLIWSNVAERETRSPRVNGHHGHATAERVENGVTKGALVGEVEPSVAVEDESELLDPREALRHRMVRAVLAELPYGDAQCLALHLVAGLNQAEVALALGITASATRRRIVHGLTMFAQRYDAAAASLGLPLDFFNPQADLIVQDGAQHDSTARPMPMVEALANELDVDPLTTNEHIAVQPFTPDDTALIWSGRIHREMAAEAGDAATSASVEAEPMFVETSLAKVGEPVEIPDLVAALPPPPDIPLAVKDVWVHVDAHEPSDGDDTLSSHLALEEISVPVWSLGGELQEADRNELLRVDVMNDSSEATAHLDTEQGNSVEVSSVVQAQVVPILTSTPVIEEGHEEAAIAEDGVELLLNNEAGAESAYAIRGEMGPGIRMVPVLTAGQSPLDVATMHWTEARVVPVLTSSPSNDQVTRRHMLAVGDDTDARNHEDDKANAPDATLVPGTRTAFVGRGGTPGVTNTEGR